MKETLILILVAGSSLFLLGYSIHMLIGGLLDETTERWIITGACLIGAIVIAFMGWDILRQRRRR